MLLVLVGSTPGQAGTVGMIAVLAPLFVVVATRGLVSANATVLALQRPQAAGAASAVLGACMFAGGILVTPLLALGGADSAVPMAAVVAGGALAALLATLLMTRSSETSERDVAVRPAPGRRGGQRLRHPAAGLRRGDHLVDERRARPPAPRRRRASRAPRRRAACSASRSSSGAAAASFRRCRMPTAALAPITAISASGQANTAVAPRDLEFIAT